LVLQQYFGTEYHSLCTDFPFPPPEAERAMFGTDHAEVGAALLEEWKMPKRVVDLVAFHHQPEIYEGAPSAMAFLRASLELSTQGDFRKLLTLPVEEVDEELIASLTSAGWSWADLQKEGEHVQQALSELKQLLS
jgi:HD-like signal output (HDOD) protein